MYADNNIECSFLKTFSRKSHKNKSIISKPAKIKGWVRHLIKKEMEVGLVDIIRQGSYNCTELILLINYEMF